MIEMIDIGWDRLYKKLRRRSGTARAPNIQNIALEKIKARRKGMTNHNAHS